MQEFSKMKESMELKCREKCEWLGVAFNSTTASLPTVKGLFKGVKHRSGGSNFLMG